MLFPSPPPSISTHSAAYTLNLIATLSMATTNLPSLHLLEVIFFTLLILPVVLFLSYHHLLSLLSFSLAGITAFLASFRRRPVFLLDYSLFLPDPDRKIPLEVSEYIVRRSGCFSPRSEAFMRGIFLKSGIGHETYAPPFFFLPGLSPTLLSAALEAEEGVLSASNTLLSKTKIPISLIDILIVSSGSSSPAPSLSSLIVNRLHLSPSTQTFNLSSMGCTAGTLAVDLAARLLSYSTRNSYALVIVTENTTFNWYSGEDRSMLISNCIFRAGAAAAILTNDPAACRQSKMQLFCSLRTHCAANDAAYAAAFQTEDDLGNFGFALRKDLVRVAGEGLAAHVRALAPWVLPWTELLRCACRRGAHVPDMTTAFEHVCIHTGGKAVIDAVAQAMRFEARVTEPARMCLHRFGNTSSSLVFYELAYFEGKSRVRKGDRVWMLAFGSGFKACSLVWRSLKDSRMDDDNPWRDCIHRYPVEESSSIG